MSDIKKKPSKNTVAAANLRIDAGLQRIAELEAQLKQLGDAKPVKFECPGHLPKLQHRQFGGRVTRPNFGQALPAGVGFHSYVKVRVEDQLSDGRVVEPTEAEVMVLLRQQAAELYPDFVDVEICEVSPLPAGW